MDTRNFSGVTSPLSASREAIGYPLEGEVGKSGLMQGRVGLKQSRAGRAGSSSEMSLKVSYLHLHTPTQSRVGADDLCHRKSDPKRLPPGTLPAIPALRWGIQPEMSFEFLSFDAHLAASIGQSRADGIPCRSAKVLKAPMY
ncbi:hypothetical protein EVAR_12194_1 [Eumeta japonica]|uniref:Uncharacterized protein n=1 Tax=Eumeta variegata TaxID=151549 RepID=A0A4C1UH34_EUMVA|nr:hypothetical protein EVAR_12194_1 [Eumeta japonica]